MGAASSIVLKRAALTRSWPVDGLCGGASPQLSAFQPLFYTCAVFALNQ